MIKVEDINMVARRTGVAWVVDCTLTHTPTSTQVRGWVNKHSHMFDFESLFTILTEKVGVINDK